MFLEKYLNIVLCSTIFDFVFTNNCEDFRSAGKNFRSNLGTKTSYSNVNFNDQYGKDYTRESKECSAEKIWLFIRHGTRYPINDDFDSFKALPKICEQILLNHLEGRGCLTEEEVFDFKTWSFPYEERDKGELHPEGSEELYAIGQKWAKLFPGIFKKEYNEENVKVEFTVKNRTQESAFKFLEGMFGEDAVSNLKLPEPYHPNYVLRLYKSCPLWMKDVYRNNKTTYKERILFENTFKFKDVLKQVSSRLGFREPLSAKILATIYDECRYETAWFPDKESIWCLPFSTHDFEVLEYHQDLKYYYEDSYGTPMNSFLTCKTMSDFYSRFNSDPVSPQNGYLYFSHDKAVLQLHTMLGLYKPQKHLKHNNYDTRRIFRTSRFGSFASNIGFVRFKCSDDVKVALFLNGHPHPLKMACGGSILCPWDTYEKFLGPIYRNCDVNKLCSVHDEL